MKTKELTDFIIWYWQHVDGQPYGISALEIAEDYLNKDKNEKVPNIKSL